MKPSPLRLLLSLPLACAIAQAAPEFTQTNLYELGQEGYVSYRIPCIVVTAHGTVLTFTSARRAVSDWANIDIMMRRSLDSGATWEARKIIAHNGKDTVDNPTAIADRTGAIHFLFQTNYARLFYMRSDDEGASFSKPVEITSVMDHYKSQYNWHVIAPGPGHAIQLSSGRLVVPVWMSTGIHDHRPSEVTVITSDDHGATWLPGEIIQPALMNMSESAAVEFSDGRVGLYIRSDEPAYRHALSVSPNGANGWSTPYFQEALYTPISFATVLRVNAPSGQGKPYLLFVHPDNRDRRMVRPWGARTRGKETILLSDDDGQTWPISKVLEPGRAGYADLAAAKDGTLYCLYERGETETNELNTRFLTVARFNREWLTNRNDSHTH